MDKYVIVKATDVGMTRQVNEDSMTIFDSPNGQVMVVCDGMGGQAAGDVASRLSVDIIESILTDNQFETPEEAIRRSVVAANLAVLNRTSQQPELEGMGSTCVMLIIKDGQVYCGWVGDSRIYYIANHTIRQISHDQSYVQQLVDKGLITAAEAANHPQKNEILNCIGLQGMTPPETLTMPITPEEGSVFLLCSDGLSGMIDDRQIERVVSNSDMTLQQKADRLITLANEAGGLDNITVEMVQFGSPAVIGNGIAAGAGTAKKKSKSLLYSIIAIIVVAVVCLAGGHFYIKQQESDKEKQMEVKKGKTEHPTERTTETPQKNSTPTTPQQTVVKKTVVQSPKKGSMVSKKIQNTQTKATKKQEEKNNNAKKIGDKINSSQGDNSNTEVQNPLKKEIEDKY